MLEYMYTGSIAGVNSYNAETLLGMSFKYGVHGLKEVKFSITDLLLGHSNNCGFIIIYFITYLLYFTMSISHATELFHHEGLRRTSGIESHGEQPEAADGPRRKVRLPRVGPQVWRDHGGRLSGLVDRGREAHDGPPVSSSRISIFVDIFLLTVVLFAGLGCGLH